MPSPMCSAKHANHQPEPRGDDFMDDLATEPVSAAASRFAGETGIRFGGLARLGHVEFHTRDLARLASYYTDVLGMSAITSNADGTYLSMGAPGHGVSLQRNERDGLAHIGFELAADLGVQDAKRILDNADVKSERKQDAEPGIPDLLELTDPEGNTIQLYRDVSDSHPGRSGQGIRPQKLGHICIRAKDVEGLTPWYEETLGFRWSDWMGDFFVFLRIGADHHTVNILAGPAAGNVMHHVAYELRDVSHLQEACDYLARNGVTLEWGPGRHGPGHNLFSYHRDPDGNIVELFTQVDIMNEEHGAFEPRPWHQDSPQRPKRWVPEPLAANAWGILPPPDFM
jgi:catechol-2,3-dioxygenase